jgi:predicted O-methyltransferase YrrM
MLARAASEDAKLVSTDLPRGAYGGGYSAWKAPVFRRLLLSGQTADFVRGDSHSPETLDTVRSTLRGSPVDVLFIDGDHSYEGVKKDFEIYSRLVRPDGLIFLHDIAEHPASRNCHVSRFWNELRLVTDAREFIENPRQGWAGIGMVRAMQQDVQRP